MHRNAICRIVCAATILIAGVTRSDAQSASGEFEHLQGGVVHGVYFVDADHGWTAEDGGRVRVTTDGGQTWTFQETPDAVRSHMREIFFLDLRRGWAVGDNGAAIFTVDGGRRWTQAVSVPSQAHIFGVHFADARHGHAVGKEGVIWATTDGGLHWVGQTGNLVDPPDLPGKDLYGVYLLDARRGFACGDHAMIWQTIDGGASWHHVPVPESGDPEKDIELWDLQFQEGPNSGLIGTAVGGLGNHHGYAYQSFDGGRTWTLDRFKGLAETLYGVAMLGDGKAVSCGYARNAWLRKGSTWTDVSPVLPAPPAIEVTPPLKAADAGDIRNVWTVGMFNVIRKSSDGGQTWADQAGETAWRLKGGFFLDENNGWVVGQFARIARTSDGGKTFEVQHSKEPGLAPVVQASPTTGIWFCEPEIGCAVGLRFDHDGNEHSPAVGRILFTFDGGDHWEAPSTPLPAGVDLKAVTSSAPNEFWAVGSGGTVLRSVDGGRNWSAIDIVIDDRVQTDSLLSVSFGASQIGIVTAASGRAFLYRGGLWFEIPVFGADGTPFSGPLRGVAMDAPDHGIVVGELGSVFEYRGQALREIHRSESMANLPPDPEDENPGVPTLRCVTIVPFTSEIYASGDGGIVLHFDGKEWVEPKSHTSRAVHAICFLSPSRGFLIGQNNGVMGYRPAD